jgi:hypothetical protein
MNGQAPSQVKNARRLSDAIIAKRYFELQRLRDEVRKAETSRAMEAQEEQAVSSIDIARLPSGDLFGCR